MPVMRFVWNWLIVPIVIILLVADYLVQACIDHWERKKTDEQDNNK